MELIKRLLPGYRLAKKKREYERYLRAQGWTKKDALIAVAKKFAGGADK